MTAAIKVSMENHGARHDAKHFIVEQYDGLVHVSIEDENGGNPTQVSLEVDEARAVAAALAHLAGESEAGR